jgi:fructose-1,6-bisphosphatase
MIQNAFVTQDLSKMVKNVSQYASLINNTIQKQIDANASMDLFNLAQYVWKDVDLINNGLVHNVFVNRNM